MPKTKKIVHSGGCGSCGLVGGCGCSMKQTNGGRKKVKKGGCSSCGLVGGCGCMLDKKGGKKKTTKVKTGGGGSIMDNIIETAKTLSIPFLFIAAKQTLQDKMNKPKATKKSKKHKKNKKNKVGGGNILNVMK